MIAQIRLLALHQRTVLNLSVLFLGKTAGLLVGLFFLPMYHRLLGAEQFGVVAVVMSLQALLTIMDLGMSTMVSRDAAVSHNASATYRVLLTAEGSLTAFYAGLAGLALLAAALGLFGSVSYVVVATGIVVFWALVLQNLYFSVLLAKRSYGTASSTQIAGSLLRAFASAYVLAFVSASLEAFMLTQVIFAIIHAAITRYFCRQALGNNKSFIETYPSLRECMGMARQGGALIVFSAAGAAVTQLDKPLVSALISSAEVAPYFLATTVCMVPISVFASPISQFCQPRVLSAVAAKEREPVLAAVRQFVSLTLLAVCVPAALLWMLREPLISLWLGNSDSASIVADYAAILLPGLAVGSLGFIPYALLVAAKDYRFQAQASVALTVFTLAAASLAAAAGSVKAVCWIYALYHASSTVVSWMRAAMLPTVAVAARYSMAVASVMLVATVIFGGILNQFI